MDDRPVSVKASLDRRIGVVLVLSVAIGTGAIFAVALANRGQPRSGDGDEVQPQANTVGCAPAEMPVADPDFVPVAGRFGPVSTAYPPLIESGEIVPPADATAAAPWALVPSGLPGFDHVLHVRDASGDRFTTYLSPKPVGGNILEYTESGGIALSQSPTHGVDAAFVAAEIADTGRVYSKIQIGDSEAIAYLADPVIRDDLRPWHLYWSDGIRDFSLTGASDPTSMIDFARSLYCG